MTKLASREIAGLDPYKFLAVLGKRVWRAPPTDSKPKRGRSR